jgi:non-specific serine/threonine protein kinase/serine/threonine-protein kinase
MREVNSLLKASRSDRLEACASDMRVGSADIDDTSIGRRIGAYRIVRELGRGGMGAVYLAERADQEFTKQVAIKLLKRGTDTDEVLRRFRSEREILARLEHPNIARLLDAGTSEDGLPYFVMEYVVGARVNDYCFAQNLSVAERLRLFLKICAAVQFAHQNLVIHRDLKPANILITSEGEPKLLDFGIAKLVSLDAGAFQLTLQDQQRLTPAYASPEQVRGDVITTVSDVYSLGALLYELLVGVSPHKFTAAHPSATELWRVVGEQAPPRPSAAARDAHLRRKLRGDLDNVLLTALRKEPARRYSGVGAFSEDIRRYLEARPVRARRATLAYKAGKFVSRNKVATAAAALALIALLVGTGVSIWNAQRAHSEARRAERLFGDVRHLANSFLFEFHDKIANLPGATDARQLVVSRALEYLDKLSRDTAGGSALHRELAEAYLKIGDVQGKPYTPNLGDSAGALRSYSRAAEIAQQLNGADAHAARRIAAEAYENLAAVQARLRQLDAATESNKRALAIGEAALAENPPDADEWRRLVASCYLGLGDAIQAGNHQRRDPELYQAALEQYRRAQPLAEALLQARPNSVAALRLAGKTYARIAGMLPGATSDEAGVDEALELHRKDLELAEAALRIEPNNSNLRRSYAVGLISKAYTHNGALRDLEAAAADCARAVEMQQAITAADPSNVEAQQDLSYALAVHGRVYELMGDKPKAAERYRSALRILEPLVAANPQNNETRFDLDEVRRGLADVAQ